MAAAAATTTTYSCKECRTTLNLTNNHLYPPEFHFDAGNKNTLSFSWVDPNKVRFEPQDRIRPFFESLNYWGLQRKESMVKCIGCGKLLGHVYNDGPPNTSSPGQFHFGPSQVILRFPRYRLKIKALLIEDVVA